MQSLRQIQPENTRPKWVVLERIHGSYKSRLDCSDVDDAGLAHLTFEMMQGTTCKAMGARWLAHHSIRTIAKDGSLNWVRWFPAYYHKRLRVMVYDLDELATLLIRYPRLGQHSLAIARANRRLSAVG